ncbi:MAG: response regulator transcription factor [Zoogloea sp.]|nr:response regulator transcription factor [Zoogloea sp.]
MNGRIRILLIDDHELFRSGIRSLLSLCDEFEIVGEAGDGLEGAKRAKQLQPDVVLLDLHMPGISGREALRPILQDVPGTHVLMLTVSEDAEDLLYTLRNGATGYLLKNIAAESLTDAVRMASRGEAVVSPLMMGKLIGGGAPRDRSAAVPAAQPGGEAEKLLSPRELDILRCLAKGPSNKEIARELDLAESTVKIHVQSILRKLALTSRVQAALYAVEHGYGQPAGSN